MSDFRNDIVKSVERSLITIVDPNVINKISNKLLCVLNDYEITKRTTELVTYDDANTPMIKNYLSCIAVDGLSKNTIYAYGRTLFRFFGFIGKQYDKVGVYDIRLYLANEKERGLSDSTIENVRSNLSSFFSWLHREDFIEKNPCELIKPIKCANIERFPFSSVELDALRHACKNLKERAIVELLASSGIRVSELCNLDVSDLDFSEMTVRVRHGKGGKDRTTYMTDVARLHMQRYLMERHDERVEAFLNKNHKRMNAGGIQFILHRIGERANVYNVHPHRFRRTFATLLANRGMAIQEIQRLLGHSNVNTTLMYVTASKKKIKASYEKYIA